MPAKSKAQQRFMGMVHALQKGEIKPSDVSDKVKKAADSMSDKDAEDFASTKHKGLPKKMKKEELQRLITKYGVKKVRESILAVKGKEDSKGYRHDEGFGGDLKGSDKKKFEKARKENAEQLGYELTGTSDIKESVNEGINDKMKKIMTKLAKSLSIKSVVDMYTGKGSLSYFLDDEKEALKLQKFLQKSFKRVRKINLDKSKGDTANFVVAADMLGLESVNEGYTLYTTDKRGKKVKKIKSYGSRQAAAVAMGKLMKNLDTDYFPKNIDGLMYIKESVNEVSGVDVAKKVLKNKQREKGIDLQTANLIVTIDKAYDKNPKLQKKFRAIQLPKMKQLIMKYYG